MTKLDWGKSSQREAKARVGTENINGDISSIAYLLPRKAPQKSRPSKNDLRKIAERAFSQFEKRKK